MGTLKVEDEPPSSRKKFQSLALTAGASITAATMSNPILGAVVALAPQIGGVFRAVFGDFVQRKESDNRLRRAYELTDWILNGLYENLLQQRPLRDDGFFDEGTNRSSAEEICDAVLEACIKQFEQKKIPYLARIYVNASFSTASPSTVHSLIQQASEKTWRHFCLLAALATDDTHEVVNVFYAIPANDLDKATDAPHIRADLERLVGRATGLISEDHGVVRLTESGRLLVDFAELGAIPAAELDTVIGVMRAARSTPVG